MHFTSITITNLFSYYDENFLSLENNNQCNITVIMGRNGYGKTSFINSIKMLFVDTAEEIRRTIQRKRTPTPKQFVMGIASEWWGILNQQARQEGEMVCSVAASWVSSEGYHIDAKRTWDLAKSYESTLTIKHSVYGVLIDDEANNFLENILPKSFLHFFFFDGENILEIAEANDSEIIKKMELLLNIRPLENMQTDLHTLSKEWQRKGESQSAKNVLKSKEREIAAQLDQKATYKEKINDLRLNIEEYNYQLKKIDKGLRWLRGGVSYEAEINLKNNIKYKEEQRDNILSELADNWKQDTVLAIHPHLIKKTLTKLESLIHSNQGEQEALLESIKQRLDNLFNSYPFSNPKLLPIQTSFYHDRILKELDAIGVRERLEDSFDISHNYGKKLFTQFSQYKNNNNFNDLHQKTKTAKTLWKEIHELNNKLKATGKLSERKQQEYQLLLRQEEKLKQKLFKLESEEHINNKELDSLRRSITSSTNELSKLEKDLRIATEFRQQYDFSLRLKEALEEVKKRLKMIKCKELEETYNQHLSTLLDSHGLIQKVAINEDFEISYHDKQDNEIGMSTISAGMKQLSATALLWALKDISGREFPIIIDTPMGRIDAKHQENLLEHYYPNVGKQVILLPTDSELDERKYQLLKPSICKLYQLHNPTGRSTEIKEKKEY